MRISYEAYTQENELAYLVQTMSSLLWYEKSPISPVSPQFGGLRKSS